MSYDAPPGAGGIRRLAVQGCQLENNPPDWASWATEPVTHRPPPSWPGHPAELYSFQRVRSMRQHGTSLLNRYAREPCDKIGQLRSVFKVLKESGNRHASPTEYPGTTDFLRVAPHGRASRPVVHDVTLRLQQASFNLADHSLVEQRAAPRRWGVVTRSRPTALQYGLGMQAVNKKTFEISRMVGRVFGSQPPHSDRTAYTGHELLAEEGDPHGKPDIWGRQPLIRSGDRYGYRH